MNTLQLIYQIYLIANLGLFLYLAGTSFDLYFLKGSLRKLAKDQESNLTTYLGNALTNWPERNIWLPPLPIVVALSLIFVAATVTFLCFVGFSELNLRAWLAIGNLAAIIPSLVFMILLEKLKRVQDSENKAYMEGRRREFQ